MANKKLLAGILVSVQNTIKSYLKKLDSGQYVMEDLREMLQFIQKTLCCKNPETKLLEDTELAVYIRKKLNRPIRVCGMVKTSVKPVAVRFWLIIQTGPILRRFLKAHRLM